ncbi:lysophospholipid acyltransferase family protein [Clostridium sp. HCP1S3_B4]|uniref:lysophospholipid acyltransferase family protein n=1 Tax=unclassified Clostridium TaxID=2614128 RepID=UPI003F88AA35
MLSPGIAKIIEICPNSIKIFMAKKIMLGYLKKYANIKIEGLENVEKYEGPKIFICNHLSNSDGLILSEILKEKYNPYFVAGVKLSNDPITNLGSELVRRIQIKPNSADKEAITTMVKAVKSGENLFIFPEGTRSRNGAMGEGKKGILLLARLTKATIIPIGITGTEILLPISKTGDMGGETWHNADVNIKFGEAVTLPKRNKEQEKHEYEDECMNVLMGGIARLLPESYRGVYK